MIPPGLRALLVAVGAALLLVLIADLVASMAGADVNWWVSIATAIVVGGFLALLLLRPKKPTAAGFTVEED